MKTTRKQLVNFAIGLVKEISKQNKRISVEYRNSNVSLWFFKDEETELISFFSCHSLKENKDKFKKAILKIRGIIKWKL